MPSNSSGLCADPSWSPCALRLEPASARVFFVGLGSFGIAITVLWVAQILPRLFLRPLGGLVLVDAMFSGGIDLLFALIDHAFLPA